jgi:DNA invertase Pin-like site-specific DNA recombinase
LDNATLHDNGPPSHFWRRYCLWQQYFIEKAVIIRILKQLLKHCHKVFQEKKSGASGKRPRLQACLEYVREGDALVVTRLDRLARSTLDLCQLADALARKQVHLQVLDQSIDTADATGRLLFNMLGAIAQFETELRAERQMDGIQKAKERGVRFGRKKTLTTAQIAELRHRRAQGVLIKTLMTAYSLSKASVYRYLSATDAPLSGDTV